MEKKHLRKFKELFKPASYFLIMRDVIACACNTGLDDMDIMLWDAVCRDIEYCSDIYDFDMDLLIDEVEHNICINEKYSKSYILDTLRIQREISGYLYGLPQDENTIISLETNDTQRNVWQNYQNCTNSEVCPIFSKYINAAVDLYNSFALRFRRKIYDCEYDYNKLVNDIKDREGNMYASNSSLFLYTGTDDDNSMQNGNLSAPFNDSNKSTPKTKGRPKQSLKDSLLCAEDKKDDVIQLLHSMIDGKKGKEVGLVVMAVKRAGIATKITYTQMRDEFGEIGNQSGYNRYTKEPRHQGEIYFQEDEITPIKERIKRVADI